MHNDTEFISECISSGYQDGLLDQRATLRDYITNNIEIWRNNKRKNTSIEHTNMCNHYIDALYNIGVHLLDEEL